MSLTAGAGTRCMSLLSSSPSLVLGLMHRFLLLLSTVRPSGSFFLSKRARRRRTEEQIADEEDYDRKGKDSQALLLGSTG